jgi:hypothetical protein
VERGEEFCRGHYFCRMVYQGKSPSPNLPILPSPLLLLLSPVSRPPSPSTPTGRTKPSNKPSDGPQIYFVIILYTYALHLRHGTYRTLPLSRSVRGLSAVGHFPDSESEDEDTHLHDVDDFHQPYPPRANGHGHRYSPSKERVGAGEVVFDAEAGSSSNMSTPRISR